MPDTPRTARPEPAPFVEVVHARLPGQVGRMRADTVRNGWRPRGKADKDAVDDAGGTVNTPATRKRAAKATGSKRADAAKTTAPKAASDTATAGAPNDGK